VNQEVAMDLGFLQIGLSTQLCVTQSEDKMLLIIVHCFSQQLSQFWYSDETASCLANEAIVAAGKGGR